jgi:pimeloyl-ACP methyl ester carboxylesterase
VETFAHGGLVFDVTDAGPAAGAPVVLLHGFPQHRSSWTLLAPLLHEAGLRTLAPDQRGYSPGARPPQTRAYRLEHLVADVEALVSVLGQGPVHLVGHDWGAAVAWATALRRPHLVRSLTAVSVPHPSAFAHAVRTSRQGLKSWYMLAFQPRGLAEALLDPPAPPGAHDWPRACAARARAPSAPSATWRSWPRRERSGRRCRGTAACRTRSAGAPVR